ncbi:MAG TPA: FAD-binding oxidoreductase [Anaerolineales bacterium]
MTSGAYTPHGKRVVVCGAGIAGVSAAYFLSRAGIRNILLIDERAPLTLTSDRSTECYRNWWPDAAVLALMNRSIDLLDQLAQASGNRFRLNRRGYLYLTSDSNRLTALRQQAEQISVSGGGPLRIHEKIGSAYTAAAPDGFRDQPDGADLLLGREIIQQHFPYVSRAAVGALHARRAGWLSAQQLRMYLLESAREMGVEFTRGRVVGVEQTAGAVSGVVLETGARIACDVFVNAAGPYFRTVGNLLGIELPVEAEVHLKLAFEDPLHVVARDAPLLIWNDPQFLAWNEDERLAFESEGADVWLTKEFPGGAHTRPEGSGESATILMLWDYRTHSIDPVFPVPLDPQYPEIVLRGLATMLPGLNAYIGHAARPRLDGGYYVRTRENRPLVGPTKIKGAYLIGALSGFGIMSACACGELLAAHVSGAELPTYASAFSLARYDDAAYVASLNQCSETGEL